MSASLHVDDLPIDGPAAPPRANGELVFAEPWQSRIFGLTLALRDRGLFEWRDFQAALIAEIDRWQNSAGEADEYRYYDCWQRAFEALLAERAICPAGEIDRRSHQLAARPHGHEHRHQD